MTRICAFLAIFMAVLLQCMPLSGAFADPVRMRNDAQIVDVQGNVIGTPNTSDPRNTAYEKYYNSVNNGVVSSTSDFYIISDPDAGFVRKDLNPPTQEAANTPTPAANITAPAQGVKLSVTNTSQTSQTLNDDPSIPVYDRLSAGGSVYDN